jgi:hypothetical protein
MTFSDALAAVGGWIWCNRVFPHLLGGMAVMNTFAFDP